MSRRRTRDPLDDVTAPAATPEASPERGWGPARARGVGPHALLEECASAAGWARQGSLNVYEPPPRLLRGSEFHRARAAARARRTQCRLRPRLRSYVAANGSCSRETPKACSRPNA